MARPVCKGEVDWRVGLHQRIRSQGSSPSNPAPGDEGAGQSIKSQHAAEQDRPDLVAARSAWRAEQPQLKPGRLVFLDETWASTNMTRRYGRSPRGRPCRAAVRHGHRKTSTFIAGLRSDGIVAPLVFDGAMNAEIFRYYIGNMLAPRLLPGDVAVIDNLPAHKGTAIRALIEAQGGPLLCLPPKAPT